MYQEIINRVPLFASLPHSEIESLAAALRPCEFPADALVFREGTIGDRFYVLIEGQVEIVKALGTGSERRLGLREAGSLIGEMSLFNQDGQRTASVRALTPLKMLEMTRADFDGLLQRQPLLAYELVRVLSTRLEESENLTVHDLLEKNRQLAQAYDDLKAAQAQIIEKEKLEAELEIARKIQRSIVPRTRPHLPGLDFGMIMEPMRSVGGDFFDFIPLDDDHLGIVIGDVSDHGIPAALFMALTYSLLRAESRSARSPGEILRDVNHHLLDMNDWGMFVTVLYGRLNRATREFEFARAGHDLPLIMNPQGEVVDLVRGRGQMLGLFSDPALDEQSITLPENSLLLMYTDGVTEARNANLEFFGAERLHTTLHTALPASAQAACDAVLGAIQSFSGNAAPQDDITLVAVQLE